MEIIATDTIADGGCQQLVGWTVIEQHSVFVFEWPTRRVKRWREPC